MERNEETPATVTSTQAAADMKAGVAQAARSLLSSLPDGSEDRLRFLQELLGPEAAPLAMRTLSAHAEQQHPEGSSAERRTDAKRPEKSAPGEPAANPPEAAKRARTASTIAKPSGAEQPSIAAVTPYAGSCRSCANEVLTRMHKAKDSVPTVTCIRCGDSWSLSSNVATS